MASQEERRSGMLCICGRFQPRVASVGTRPVPLWDKPGRNRLLTVPTLLTSSSSKATTMQSRLFTLLLALTMPALSSAAPPARVTAAPVPAGTATALKLDGNFSEAIWEHAPAVTEFRQREPKEGAEPSFATEVKVAYDTSRAIRIRRRLLRFAHGAIRTRHPIGSASSSIPFTIDELHSSSA